jgi:hypothetical protein
MEWAGTILAIIGLHVNYWADTHQNFRLKTFSLRSLTVGHWVPARPRICTLSKWRDNITSSSFHPSHPNLVCGVMLKGFFLPWHNSLHWVRASSFTRFLDHTQRRTTHGRTPLDEWSTRRRDLYLTTHNSHNRQISMPPAVFEPTISAG